VLLIQRTIGVLNNHLGNRTPAITVDRNNCGNNLNMEVKRMSITNVVKKFKKTASTVFSTVRG
jgi:hypothetical protein